MADASNRAEYLKRYMSKDELAKDRKKKTKKIKRSKDSKLKIIDDDLDLKKKKTGESARDDEFNEEAPTVAEIIDERPKHIQQLEEYRKNSRWKILGDDEDETSALDYGVISQKHTSLRGSDSEKDNLPSRRRHDTSDSDSSPARAKPEAVKHSNNKITDRTSQRPNSGSNCSSIRKDKNIGVHTSKNSGPDISPPRKKPKRAGDRPESDSDASPPRKQQARNQSEKPSSPNSQKVSNARLKSGASSDSDNSPPRRGAQRHDSESDSIQLPRKKARPGSSDSDQSPPRKVAAGSNVDQSPPRRKRQDSSSSDQSPPRKKQPKLSSGKNGNDSRERRTGLGYQNSLYDTDHEGEGQKKATKTLGGAKAGLSSAKEMREEAKKLREKEDRSFQNIGDDKLGRNAKTVVRNKETGKKRDLKAEEAKNEEEEKKKKAQIEKYQQWGKGLKQQEMRDSRLQDQVHEASKPLARFKDDKELDEMKRREERLEDPMLNFIRKKKEKEEQKSGKKKPKELPRYKGPQPPPNRYNLQPGYRWDGVDRSNGFENKFFASLSNKKAIQEIAYKWSTEDM